MTTQAHNPDWTLPRDGETYTSGGRVYTYHQKAADHALDFIKFFIKHTEGKCAGDPFVLEPWQRWMVGTMFGWLWTNSSGQLVRRYRTVFLFVARKNGKTALAAALAAYLLIADGEAAAQVYAAAADREQASIILTMTKRMVEQEPELRAHAEPLKYAIVCRDTGSTFKALSSDADTKHGTNPHGLIIDELHAHKNRDLYDVLMTGRGARSQPMTIITTTAGFDKHSICYEVYSYAKSVLDGTIEDPSFLPMIFEASPEDDWTDPETWRKANPNMDVAIAQEYLADECRKAQQLPSYENTFKRLHLNIWTEQATRWLPLEIWDECAGQALELEQCRGREAYLGLDMSSTNDITALVGVLPNDSGIGVTYDVLCKFWVPAESIARRSREEGVPYEDWQHEGLIDTMSGRTIDQRLVKDEILRWCSILDVREVAADGWNTSQILKELAEDHDVTIVKVGQGYASMNEPTKALMRIALENSLNHGGHKVLRWMAGNVAVEQDPAGNIKPSKRASNEKIDGIVALVMALGRALLHEQGVRDYEDDGHGLYVL